MARHPALERRIGHRFKDPTLLQQALTHRSFGSPHNERLEFLGDGVIGCVIAQELYGRFPGIAEGELSRLRASLVRQAALATVARSIELSDFLRLGEGEIASGGTERPSILADALEAVFGAVFVDGGYEAVHGAVRHSFAEALRRSMRASRRRTRKPPCRSCSRGGGRSFPSTGSWRPRARPTGRCSRWSASQLASGSARPEAAARAGSPSSRRPRTCSS